MFVHINIRILIKMGVSDGLFSVYCETVSEYHINLDVDSLCINTK